MSDKLLSGMLVQDYSGTVVRLLEDKREDNLTLVEIVRQGTWSFPVGKQCRTPINLSPGVQWIVSAVPAPAEPIA